MNKTAIKNYAIWARVQLIESAKQRAFEYAITDGENDLNLEIINGRILSSEEKNQRAGLISLIKQKGFEQVMEEAAYTWFNRFIALRFMEVNGYLPSKVRVFTDENNEFKPQILKEAMTVELDGLDRNRILGLIEKQDNEELFKYLVITQCNSLSFGLPGMFETISNWTELLFPVNLLKADSVIGQMITNIPEEDWTDQVQIIGWLYQYYNSELKDDTFAKLKRNIKITKERIPAATQLFTPDWIVRYMVENSLGRLWYEGHPGFDKSEWKYYLDEAEQEPEVEEELRKIRAEYAQIKPEEIKVIDPCMGSGHILVYAFDVLMQIYTSAGWSERDAAKSILENNLFGLDIDDRAGQLAYFAVMMKARKHNRRILNGEVRPKVLAIQESNGIDINFDKLGPEKPIAQKLIKDLKDAKEYGSILNLNVKQAELDALKKRLEIIDEMSTEGSFLVQYEVYKIINSLYPFIELAEVMIQKYDVVVTNPPYMGSAGMNVKMADYCKTIYSCSKEDLYSVFIEKNIISLKTNGFLSMITMHSWMFLSSFGLLRDYIINNYCIKSMLHFGSGAFDNDVGTIVQSVSFCIQKSNLPDYLGLYKRLLNGRTPEEKGYIFSSSNEDFLISINDLKTIPNHPIAYWVSKNMRKVFATGESITRYVDTFQGIITGDNEKFLRAWFEVNHDNMVLNAHNISDIDLRKKYWIPYNKGGSTRKWYGIQDYIINWKNGPKDKTRGREGFSDFYLREYASWSYTVTDCIPMRFYPYGFLWDVRGSGIMPKDMHLFYLMGLISSKVGVALFKINNSTLSCQVENIQQLPIIINDNKSFEISSLVNNCIEISKSEWNGYESSWDFKKHPLV